MTQSVIKNEIYMSSGYIRQKALIQDGICIVGSDKVTEYLKAVTEQLECTAETYENAGDVNGAFSNMWYVLDADNYSADDLRAAVAACEHRKAKLVCAVLLSHIRPNNVISRYAEMELITAMDDTLGGIREILRDRENVCVIFLDRIIGAEFDSLGLASIAKEAQDELTVTVSDDMAETYTSALYISDAIDAVFTVSKHGKSGNVYNASSYYLSLYRLRSEIYQMLAGHGVKLKLTEGKSETAYAALSAGKLRSLGFENVCGFSDMLRYTMLHHLERFSVQTDNIRNGYSGKLGMLREIEKEMLREIDRICRKHDIKYFICYGTMLGAVRHGGFIPWDDDVDVEMLRTEFEKFRQIAPKELNGHFSYESHINGNGYHYFFDRITAKDTYFASKYSDSYEMPKGISIDIFVADSVPADPKAAYRFWKKLMRKRMIMNVRWKNTARRDKAYLLSKLLLPILRLRSMDSYSRSYEKAVRKYEHKDTGWVMPASSDHKFRGTFPIETFSEVIPYRFEDVDTFIPVGYDGFLKAWYTDNYMDMLPLCEQNPFHDYYRLDLGSNIDPGSDIHFDYSGELK